MEEEANISTQLYESNNNNQHQHVFNKRINNIMNAGESSESAKNFLLTSSKQMEVDEKCTNVAGNVEFPLHSSSSKMEIIESALDFDRECANIKFPFRWSNASMRVKENEKIHRNIMFPLQFSSSNVKMKPPTSALLKHLQVNLDISENMGREYINLRNSEKVYRAAEYKRFPLKRLNPKKFHLFPIMNINEILSENVLDVGKTKTESFSAQNPAITDASDKPQTKLNGNVIFKAIVTQKTRKTIQDPIKFPLINSENQDIFGFPIGLIQRSKLNINRSVINHAIIYKSRLITSTIKTKQLCSRIGNISYEHKQFPVYKSEQKNNACFPFCMTQFISNSSSILLNELQGSNSVLGKHVIDMNSLKNLNEEETIDHRKLQFGMSSRNNINKLEEVKLTLNMNCSSVLKEVKETEEVLENQLVNMSSTNIPNHLHETKDPCIKNHIQETEKQVLETYNEVINMNSSSSVLNEFKKTKVVFQKQSSNLNLSSILKQLQETEKVQHKSFDNNASNKHRIQNNFPFIRVLYGNLTRFPIFCAHKWQLKMCDYQDKIEILKIRLSEPKLLTTNKCFRNEIMPKEYKQFPILNIQSRLNKYSTIFPIRYSYRNLSKENNYLVFRNVFKENRKFSIDNDAVNDEISATMTQSCSSKYDHDRATAVAATAIQDHHLAQQVHTKITTKTIATSITKHQQEQKQKSNNCCVEQQHMYNDVVSAAAPLPTTAIIMAKNINNIPEEQQKNTYCISKNDESNNLADISLRSDLAKIYDEKATRITPPMSEDFIVRKQNISNNILKSACSNSTNNNNYNITTTNLENLKSNSHKQHSQLHSHSPKRSDVHDTSSQEELVQLVAVSAESGTRLPSSLPPLSSSWSSSSFALTTHENRLKYNNNSQLVQVEENNEYNLNKLEVNEECSDVFNLEQQQLCFAETFNDSAVEPPETSISLSVQSAKFNEMTVTKVGDIDGEDSEELNLSNSSLNDNQQSIIDDPIDEMKFEMRSVKGTTPSSLRMKNELNAINLPNITRSSSAAHIKNLSYSVDLPTTKYGFNVGSRGAAVSAVSRSENEVSRSSSVDAISVANSVLPTRTLLRRQRRLLSQDSTQQQQNPEDKPEDPIERLNRLRARISGALSEVKGVLTKYSTEGEGEGVSEQSTAMGIGQPKQSTAAIKKVESPKKESDAVPKKDDAAPVIFRFVRKVRRRSMFDEEEENKEIKDQVKEEVVVSGNLASKPSEETSCKEVKNLESKVAENTEGKEVKNLESNQVKNIEPKDINKHNAEGNLNVVEKELKKTDKNNNEYGCKEAKNLESKQANDEDHKTQVCAKQTQNESENPSVNKVITNRERPALKVLQKPSIENKQKFESEIIAILSRKSPIPEGKSIQTPQLPDAATETDVAKKLDNKLQSSVTEIVTETKSKDEARTENKTEQILTATGVKLRKKLTVVKPKDDEVRRASIAAMEESKIEPPIDKEIPQKIKAQRRPSDSEAVIKKKVIAARNIIKKNETIVANLKAPTINITQPQNDVTLLLATVKEEKSSDESANESKNNNQTNKTATAAESTTTATTKPKRRLILTKSKSMGEVRRASIAAVEESQIEPPTEETKPLMAIKTQRRPSDSEAVVKRKKVIAATKATTSGINSETTTTSTPKVKLITTKVRRTSLKGVKQENEFMKVNNKSSTATIDQSLITENINEISSSKDATTTTTTRALPTQLAIDLAADDDHYDADAIVNDDASTLTTCTKVAAAAVATETIPKNKTTKDFRSATKLDDQNVEMVATLVSPLRASEPSSHQQSVNAAISKTTITRAELAELVGETIIVVPTKNYNNNNNRTNSDNISIELKDNSKISEIQKESELVLVQETVRNQNEKSLTQSELITEIPDISKTLNANIKELINQKILPTKNSLNQKQEHQHQNNNNQQVPTIDIATVSDTSKTDIAANAKLQSSLSAVNETHNATKSTTIDAQSINDEQATETTKASNTSTTSISVEEIITANAAAAAVTATKTNEYTVTQKMPELQVVPTPVKTVPVFTDKERAAASPFNDFHAQKKLIFKKIIRKNSIDKTVVTAKKKLAANNENNKSFDKESEKAALVKISNDEKATAATKTKTAATIDESATATTIDAESEAAIAEVPIEPSAPPKKPRKVKKKVIIKRQQRKLSISDTFFRESDEPVDAKKLPEIETLEKAIEYVTDDEADAEEPEPVKVLKACIKHREYQVGDWVMYGERYRKTQVRWKKGQIIERITSISYRIDIDGQEISAHISYIKKFTDRKVNFGGKEYLEIDYEQIAEEEKKARSYSIWNMV